jgi:hypothetical protein
MTLLARFELLQFASAFVPKPMMENNTLLHDSFQATSGM